MTEWILITMLCTRWCIPQYAEVMPTKAACEARIVDTGGNLSRPSHYCVPRIKENA